MIKKLLYILIGVGIASAGVVYAAPGVNLFRNIWPETDSLYYNGTTTKAWLGVVTDQLCLTADSCRTTWPTGGGGGGATTTIFSNATSTGPAFTFATGTMTGLNLNITGSGSSVTFSPQLQSGYTIPTSTLINNLNQFYTYPSTTITSGLDLNWNGGLNVLDSKLQKYLGEGYKSPSTASTTGWTNPDLVKVADNNSATASVDSGSSTGPLETTGYGFAIPPNAEILGIQVEWRKQKTGGGCTMSDDGAFLLKAGSPVGSDKSQGCWSSSMGYVTYGGPTDLWGTTWTPTDINHSGFGASLSAHDTGGNLYNLFIDHVRILVYYKSDNQTITLSGDVSGSGTSSVITTIGNDKVTEAMLKVVDTPTDEDLFTYESSTGDFEWHTPAQLNLPTYSYASSSYAHLWNILAGTNITVSTSSGVSISVVNSPSFSGTLSVTGTSTLATTSITSLSVSSLTSGKCVQAAAGGLLTTVADACGTGGSGNSAWTIGSGLIHNATSTDEVGIGTSTPDSTLTIQGNGATTLLRIASSTGANLFQINASGNILLPNAHVINWNDGDITLTHSSNELSLAGGSLITQSITPTDDDSYDLGTTGTGWSGLHLSGNADIEWNSNDVVIDQSSNLLQFTGASTGYMFDAPVGIGTTTPQAKLVVVGTAGNNPPLIVSSSTGNTLFQIGVNGSTTIASLNASNCDVMATTQGSLYCSTNGGGGAWGTITGTLSDQTDLQAALDARVLYSYASSTFPSFSYGTSTYVSFGYASSTFPSFGYASTTFPNVTLAGENYLALSGQQITAADVNLTGGANITGVLPIANGGTATSTFQSGSVLFYNGSTISENATKFIWDNSAFRLGINSSTPIASLVVMNKPNTADDIFRVTTSTGAQYLKVASNGSTTLSSLGTGLVRSSSGSLYTDTTTYLTSAITAVSGMTGPSVHVASTSDTNILLSINTTTANTLTFVPGWAGSLAVARGGTGATSFTPGFHIIGAGTNALAPGLLRDNGTVAGINATSSSIMFNIQGTAGANDVFSAASSSGNSILMIDKHSRVGVNSTTPTATLAVQGRGGDTFDLLRVATSTGVLYMNISNSGRVGIGTTSASSTLSVQGFLQIPVHTATGTLTNTGQLGVIVHPNGFTGLTFYNGTENRYLSDVKTLPWTLENGVANEDDTIWTPYSTSTIVGVSCINKSFSDSVKFNIIWDNSRATATGSATSLFSSAANGAMVNSVGYLNCNATTTPYSTTTFANTLVKSNQSVRYITNTSSSSQFTIMVHYREQP